MKFQIAILLFQVLLYACNGVDNSVNPDLIRRTTISSCEQEIIGTNGWAVPQNQVLDGGPGKDGIPALENAEFISANEAVYLEDDDLIIGYINGDEIKAYPHIIMDYHEIVNDEVGGKAVAVTYCPLTGTSLGWNREFNGQVTTFGVSGLLYNSNLIPYDRKTDSNWSQMLSESINGEFIGDEVETFPLIETTWKTWRDMYPSTLVLSLNTTYSRNYGFYPYGDYKENHENLIFPVANKDNRLLAKERVLGVFVEGDLKVYQFVEDSELVEIYNDTFNEKKIVVVSDATRNFIVAFENKTADSTSLLFTPIQGQNDVILTDEEGNLWNILGEAIEGPRQGEKLNSVHSYIGYWFSFAAFFPCVEIF